jgi:hypothetical protein
MLSSEGDPAASAPLAVQLGRQRNIDSIPAALSGQMGTVCAQANARHSAMPLPCSFVSRSGRLPSPQPSLGGGQLNPTAVIPAAAAAT